jgi:hypothetical protein
MKLSKRALLLPGVACCNGSTYKESECFRANKFRQGRKHEQPDDGVSWRRITGTVQVAPGARELYRAGL